MFFKGWRGSSKDEKTWAVTKSPCQIMYNWTRSPLQTSTIPIKCVSFLLRSIFWTLCLQKKVLMARPWLAPCGSFPSWTICSSYLSTFGHLTYLFVLNVSPWFFYNQHYCNYSPARCLWLGGQPTYSHNASTLSSKTHLSQRLHSRLPLRPALVLSLEQEEYNCLLRPPVAHDHLSGDHPSEHKEIFL